MGGRGRWRVRFREGSGRRDIGGTGGVGFGFLVVHACVYMSFMRTKRNI